MNKLKKIIVFLLLFFGGLTAVYLYKRYQTAPTLALFNEELINESGNKCNLENYKGRAIIISFYASWCGDCIRELNDLNSVYDKLKNIEIICITDEHLEKLHSFKARKNFPFQFYKTEKIFSDLDIHSIPVTYLINTKGEVVYKKVGAVNWKDYSFLQYATNLLQ